MTENIQEWITAQRDAFDRALEDACWNSLTAGWGVRVRWDGPNWTISLDPEVPVGEVWEHQ